MEGSEGGESMMVRERGWEVAEGGGGGGEVAEGGVLMVEQGNILTLLSFSGILHDKGSACRTPLSV